MTLWIEPRVLSVLRANMRFWYLDPTGTNWLRDNMPTLAAYL